MQRLCVVSLSVRRGIVILLCLALGTQWALLQGIARTGMLLRFASQGTIIEAVEKTFDGQHACPLCAKVKEGQKSDSKQPKEAGKTLKEIDAVLVYHITLIPPVGKRMSFAILRESPVIRTHLPEPPPPRRGLVLA